MNVDIFMCELNFNSSGHRILSIDNLSISWIIHLSENHYQKSITILLKILYDYLIADLKSDLVVHDDESLSTNIWCSNF